jgi:hypothetical protein
MLAVVFKFKFNFTRFLLLFVLCDTPKLEFAVALANLSFDFNFFNVGAKTLSLLYYG